MLQWRWAVAQLAAEEAALLQLLRCLLVRQIRQVADVLQGCAGRNWRCTTGACLRSIPCRDQHAPGSCGTYTCLNIARSPWVQIFAANAACSSSCCSCGPAAFLYTCVLLRYVYDQFLNPSSRLPNCELCARCPAQRCPSFARTA